MRAWIFLIVLLAPLASGQEVPAPEDPAAPGVIVPLYPVPGQAIPDATPTVRVHVNATDVDPDSLALVVDDFFEIRNGEYEGFLFDEGIVNATIPALVAFKPGMHNLTLRYDAGAGPQEHRWNFTMDPKAGQGDGGVSLVAIVFTAGAIVAVALLGGLGFGVYLWLVKGYSWRKFLVRFPKVTRMLGFYVPLGIAVIGVLAGLAVVATQDLGIRFLPEFVIISGVAVATIPYAVQSLRGRGARRVRERAFAQFLFELADSMRGGIDPVKSIQELAKGGTGPLKQPLRIAADNLKIGRPLEEVLLAFGAYAKSPLVDRYAGLVAEAAKAGGDVSIVIYRAAKDMEELTKIELDRASQMKGPVMTMYIAFGVLFLITASLIDFAPALAEMDLAAFGLGGEDANPGPAFDIAAFEQSFFHLMLVTSIGTGLLVGSFTEGNVRYGLHHMLLMVGISVIGYPMFVL